VLHPPFRVDSNGVTHYRNDKRGDMTIDLNPEQEQIIRHALRAGVISTADEVVKVGIEAIRQRLGERDMSQPPGAAEQWSQEFYAWVHGHPTTTPLLSDEAISRESI